jgi:hypothetical protein
MARLSVVHCIRRLRIAARMMVMEMVKVMVLAAVAVVVLMVVVVFFSQVYIGPTFAHMSNVTDYKY